jgi:hypothetical protein
MHVQLAVFVATFITSTLAASSCWCNAAINDVVLHYCCDIEREYINPNITFVSGSWSTCQSADDQINTILLNECCEVYDAGVAICT